MFSHYFMTAYGDLELSFDITDKGQVWAFITFFEEDECDEFAQEYAIAWHGDLYKLLIAHTISHTEAKTFIDTYWEKISQFDQTQMTF